MKITGAKKLARQLGDLPDASRAHIQKAIRLNVEEGARVARTLAPVLSGETRDQITTEFALDGMSGTVLIIDNDAAQADKDRAYAIEHGRKAGDRGTTQGAHYAWRTRAYLAKKFKNRIARAIRRAAREVSNG